MSTDCSVEHLLRHVLDEDRPGWTEEEIWCPLHRSMHNLVRKDWQISLLPSTSETTEKRLAPRRYAKGVLLETGVLCFHGNGSTAIYGACACCGTRLHVHHDELAGVKSGRHGAAYLEERCPACHRTNAVYPDRQSGGIRTVQLIDGAPVLQMKLLGGR